MNLVETYDLTKSYGRHTAVDQVNLVIPAGSIFGIIGASGAGKSTLLRLLATLAAPTAGDAVIADASLRRSPARVRRIVGYMPQVFGMYPDMCVSEYLQFFAASYGVSSADQPALVRDLLALVDLTHQRDAPLTRLTRGMRQRLGLARALTYDPQILCLDEPISGSDPRAHVELRELIKELRSMGKTIVVTTSSIADITNLCTHLAVMDHGRVVLSGDYATIYPLLHHERNITIRFFGNASLTLSILRSFRGVREARLLSSGQSERPLTAAGEREQAPILVTVLKEVSVAFDGNYQEASDLLRMLMRSGVQVVSFTEQNDPAQALIVQSAVIEPQAGEAGVKGSDA